MTPQEEEEEEKKDESAEQAVEPESKTPTPALEDKGKASALSSKKGSVPKIDPKDTKGNKK